MPNKFKNLKVIEVSLVDKAANKRKFAVLKSEGSDGLGSLEKEGGYDTPNNVTLEETTMNEEEVKAAIDTAVAQALADQKAQLEKEKEDAVAKAQVENNGLAELKKQADDQARIIAEFQKAEEIRKIAEFTNKAQQLANLGISAEFGQTLKAISESNPEQYVSLEKALFVASETISKSALMKEIGQSGEGDTNSNSITKLEQEAAKLREADSSLTEEAAITKALELNPKLYNEYLMGV